MNQLLKGKTALVTGASSGFGEAIAKVLAEHGVNLILVARRLERLNALKKELEQKNQIKVHALQLDVAKTAEVSRLMEKLPPEFQCIDILVNNAGCAIGLETLAEGNIEDWETMLDINVKGLLAITRTVLPSMLSRNQGHIVNIGSTSAHMVYAKGGVYCATKHAVQAINKALNIELAQTPIRVTEIDPGAAETEFSLVRFKGDVERAKAVYNHQQPLIAADIADTVLFALTRPAHVNIAQIVLYPTDQPATMRPK